MATCVDCPALKMERVTSARSRCLTWINSIVALNTVMLEISLQVCHSNLSSFIEVDAILVVIYFRNAPEVLLRVQEFGIRQRQ